MTGVSKNFDGVERGVIYFSAIAEILSPKKLSNKYISVDNDVEPYITYKERIDEIINNIKTSNGKNLSDYVEVINKLETGPAMEIVSEVSYAHFAKYEIIIKGLDIQLDSTKLDLIGFSPNADIRKTAVGYYGTHKPEIRIKFENNRFIPKITPLKGYVDLTMNLGGDAYINFTRNKFEGVNLVLKFDNTGNAFVFLESNTFESSVIFEGGAIRKTSRENLNCNVAKMSCNKFTTMHIGGMINFFFVKKNTFEQISMLMLNLPLHIHWNRYQILDKKGNHAHYHKKLFIELKKETIKKNDKFQELLFTREIEICERKIIKKEIAWWKPTQDKVVLFIGWLFSDHGTSWLRPLGWLAGANFAVAGLAYYLTCYDSNFWYIFWELLNPLSNLAETASDAGGKNKTLLSFLNAFQKLFYAGMAYETIKVFRRFIAK